MNDETERRVHWSFWLIGVIALVWNVGGVINSFVQMNSEMLDAYRESERAIIVGRPAWATAAFAIAVFAMVWCLDIPETMAKSDSGLRSLQTHTLCSQAHISLSASSRRYGLTSSIKRLSQYSDPWSR